MCMKQWHLQWRVYRTLQLRSLQQFAGNISQGMSRFPLTLLLCISTLNIGEGMYLELHIDFKDFVKDDFLFSSLPSLGSGEWGTWSPWMRVRQCPSGDCVGQRIQKQMNCSGSDGIMMILPLESLTLIFTNLRHLWVMEYLGTMSRGFLLFLDTY